MQKVNQSTEEQLKKAREAGLTEARESYAVCPHGKVAEMDVFSWVKSGPVRTVLRNILR